MVTDTKKLKKDDPGDPEICSVFQVIHKFFNTENIDTVSKECGDGSRGCVECKKQALEALIEYFKPMREKRKELEKNMDYVYEVLQKGAQRARHVAQNRIQDVRKKIGLDY